MVRATFLGTNGWYDTQTGNTPSVLIETGERYIILDAGFGFYKAKDRIKDERPVSLFVSHLHLDHLIGLHTLPLFKFTQGIDIYAPARIEKGVKAFLKRPYTSPPLFLQTKLRFHTLDKARHLPFVVSWEKLRHSVLCYGYRFILEGRKLAYCTDTGMCANLKKLAKDTALLITECAMSPEEKGPNLFHLTPATAAKVAKESNAKKLALFHFDPGKYPALKDRERAESSAREIFQDVIAANDDTMLEL
jgi:ribonuclease BN (tRNA processing enzyme)